MGYVPPRPQRPDESAAEYIAYLERSLGRRVLLNLAVIPAAVTLAVAAAIAWLVAS